MSCAGVAGVMHLINPEGCSEAFAAHNIDHRLLFGYASFILKTAVAVSHPQQSRSQPWCSSLYSACRQVQSYQHAPHRT